MSQIAVPTFRGYIMQSEGHGGIQCLEFYGKLPEFMQCHERFCLQLTYYPQEMQQSDGYGCGRKAADGNSQFQNVHRGMQ